jgi:7-carboxy-7-deazaguanine synthase (Cx14CxxC type)
MSYAVKSIYLTIQGEGARTGRRAVFCRFSGCNLWSGIEAHRAGAICSFCDTEFAGTDGPGGGKFADAASLALAVSAAWDAGETAAARRFVVCSGGEPLLQMDEAIVEALHAKGFEVAVETNGTCHAPLGIDWICVSPKAGAPLVLTRGHELKLVFPQAGVDPIDFVALDFQHFFLQPMYGPYTDVNTELAAAYCREHPPWRLSLQVHRMLGMP